MHIEREDPLDPSQPSLLVTYGNTTRKVRPLDRELLVLGRGSMCDINLVSPEVANIHALIMHATEGWRVRDCGSRMGTRLNGRAVQECLLGDGDVLQIGSFSFHLNLPGKSAHGTSLRPDYGTSLLPDKPPPHDKNLRKLQRSRRHLAELALSLRRRCRGFQDHAAAIQQAEHLVEERHAELARQREALWNQRQEMESKATELLQLEQELNARFTVLEHELADFQARQDQAEAELVRCQSETGARLQSIQEREAAIKQAEASFAPAAAELQTMRAQVREAQATLARREAEVEAELAWERQVLAKLRAELAVGAAITDDAATAASTKLEKEVEDGRRRELERRAEELDHFANHLRRSQGQLAERDRALAFAREQLQTEAFEIEQARSQLAAEQDAWLKDRETAAETSCRRDEDMPARREEKPEQSAQPGQANFELEWAELQEKAAQDARERELWLQQQEAILADARRREEALQLELEKVQARADEDQRLRLCDLEEREAQLADELAALEGAREEIRQATETLQLRVSEESARAATELERRGHELEVREARLAADQAGFQCEHEEMAARCAQQREKMVKGLAELREQRTEVIRLMGELRQARLAAATGPGPANEVVQRENESLRQQLALHQVQLQAVTEAADKETAAAGAAVQQLQIEANELAQHLESTLAEAADLTSKLEAAQAAPPVVVSPSAVEDLEAQLVDLTGEVQSRDATIREMHEELKMFRAGIENSGGYEVELRRFRVEVERDRKTLEEQRELVCRHQEEMEEELRQAELHMARERAQMARDRAELQRLREEIQIEREHLERVGALHQRLPSLHRFRADLTDKKPAGTPQ